MKKLIGLTMASIWIMFSNSALMVWFTSDVGIFWKMLYTVFVLCLGYIFKIIYNEGITV